VGEPSHEINESLVLISCNVVFGINLRIYMKKSNLVVLALLGALGVATSNFSSAEETTKTVAALNQNKATLAGQKITAQGKVVKVNNGIMGRNFVHIQDGTVDASSNNLIVTSKQTANVGEQVVISGMVVLNRDFGSGYSYPLLIEEANIAPKK
jgi:hypothetical protein